MLRRHLGKELLLAAIILALAWLMGEEEAFVDGLKESFVLLLGAAIIYFGIVFVYQLLLAPVQVMRELEDVRLAQLEITPEDQRIAFKDRLIWLHEQGQPFLYPTAEVEADEWAEDAERFLRAALGEGEAHYFRVRVGAGGEEGLWVGQGINHLHDLMAKSDTLTIRPDFDPEEWRT